MFTKFQDKFPKHYDAIHPCTETTDFWDSLLYWMMKNKRGLWTSEPELDIGFLFATDGFSLFQVEPWC